MVAYLRRVNLVRHVLPFGRDGYKWNADIKIVLNKHCVDWIYLDPGRI
jgi:hypothetical protein